MDQGPADAERLWLDTLQQVVGRAAHELKGALNGVSVNLEVVRGRSAQAELPASALARFATSAATQLDHVIEMNEALLGLARRPREPADVAATLRQLGALLVPGTVAGGGALAVDVVDGALPVTTAVPGALARTVLAGLLLAVIESGGGTVRLRTADGGVLLDAVASKDPIRMDPRIVTAAAAAGIRSQPDGLALTLTLPSPATALASGR